MRRRGIIVIVGSLVAAAFLATSIYALSSVDRSYKRTASGASRAYAERAAYEIQHTCRIPARRDGVACLNAATAAVRDNQRLEEGLVAQQISAWWTKITAIAALIAITLSALGAYLVWTTFRETRNANTIARETAKLQLRAYVTLDKIIAKREDVQGGDMVVVDLIWKNAGVTPANGVRRAQKLRIHPIGTTPPEDDFDTDGEVSGEVHLGPGQELTHRALFPASHFAQQFIPTVIFFGWVEYTDIYKELHRSEFAVDISRFSFGGTGHLFNVTITPLKRHNGMDETCLRQPPQVL